MRQATSPLGPDSRIRARQRRVLLTLCVTEITSYGILYYALSVMITEISATTGWSPNSITGAFSASQLVAALIGIPLGRHLDRHGPRTALTAGSALAALATVAIGLAPNLPLFIGAWLLAGVAMGAILYPPAFTILTRWYGPRRVQALTWLTLAAGLASTVFAPLTALLMQQTGWRHTYLILALVLAAVTIPAHWWGLRDPWPGPPADPRQAHSSMDRAPDRIARSLPFMTITAALSLSSFAAFAALLNLVALLQERGLETDAAALALGLGGVGQVAGRLAYPLLSRHLGVRIRTVLILATAALTIAALGLLSTPMVLIGASIGAGMARGLLTLVQATAVSDRWGTTDYGRLTGLLSAPVTVSIALAFWAGTLIADLTRGYGPAYLIIAIIGFTGAALALKRTP